MRKLQASDYCIERVVGQVERHELGIKQRESERHRRHTDNVGMATGDQILNDRPNQQLNQLRNSYPDGYLPPFSELDAVDICR